MSDNLIEWLLLGSLVVAWLLRFVLGRRAQRLFALAAGVSVVLVIVDVSMENVRWQIVPAYVLAAVFLLMAMRGNPVKNEGKRWRRRIVGFLTGSVTLVALAVAVGLPWLFPMITVPEPVGSFAVGFSDIHLVDPARQEEYTDDPADHRELMVRVWYPAASVEGREPEPLLRELPPLMEIISRVMPLPGFVFGHLQQVPSHSYLDAPVDSEKKFPVLLYSHGNSFYASQSVLLMEHLASHGYVILAIDHPYQASLVQFPDGRVAKYQDGLPNAPERTPEELEQMRAQADQMVQSFFVDDYEEHYELMSSFLDAQPEINDRVELWVDDSLFVLDQLERAIEDESAPLANAAQVVDLERLGVFGMSLGGATAGVLCAREPRVKAGLNMDGAQFGNDAASFVLERPFFLFNADRRKNPDDPPVNFELNEYLYRQSKAPVYSLSIKGATHGSFADFGIMSRLTGRFIATIDPWEMERLTEDYTLAFFNKHLKDTSEPLLTDSSPGRPSILKFEFANVGDRQSLPSDDDASVQSSSSP